MADTIKNFMWGYQRHFRLTMSLSAEKLFHLIDPALSPGIFLVGCRTADSAGTAVAVEPESNFWLSAEELEIRWPEARPGPLAPVTDAASEGADIRKWRRSMRQTVKELIDTSKNFPAGRRYFVATPVEVGHYWVAAVLGLDAAALKTYGYGVAEENTVLTHDGRLEFLLQAMIEIFLSRAVSELGQPDPFGNILPGSELLRTAASQLVDSLVFNATGQYESNGFYEHCVRLSSAFYERTEAAGTMVVADRDDKNINFEVRFGDPPHLSDIRKARKLLQTANDFDLHTDGANIYGLLRRSRSKSRLKVNFLGHRQWQIVRGGRVLLEVKYDEPGLPRPPYNKEQLAAALLRSFPTLRPPQTENLLRLIDGLATARHGAMLVISEGAAREAKRLRFQATPIVRKKLASALLENLSTIDGAVLVNPRGIAFAIGVILDGVATSNGNTARGARYNSAIRYQEYLRTEYKLASFIVVVSDDGDTSFLPNFNVATPERVIAPEQLYEEIADLTRYGKSLFARHDSDMIKVLFEPLRPERDIDIEQMRPGRE